MSYMPIHKAFNLTATKMEYWHRAAKHQNLNDCVFCLGDMKKVAAYLTGYGLEIMDVGHAWVKIKAEKNYRPFHGGQTDESRLLYDLVSGKKQTKEENLKKEKTLALEKVDLTCPECNSILKVRKSRYGQFLGCSNYPKCNFTRNI